MFPCGFDRTEDIRKLRQIAVGIDPVQTDMLLFVFQICCLQCAHYLVHNDIRRKDWLSLTLTKENDLHSDVVPELISHGDCVI